MSSGKRKRASVANGGGDGGSGSDGADAVPEVGRLVDSSQADDRRMIRLVRERRLLYARNNMPVASYYTQVKKLWQQVANNMGWSVADVRRKWSHIRNSYSRHLRNEMYGVRTGRGRMVSKWYLADELDFLREHMATDTRPSRFSYAPLYLDMKPPLAELPPPPPEHVAVPPPSAEPVDLKPFISNPWFALSSPPPAAPPRVTGEPQLRYEDSSSPHSFEPDENSAYFHFFRGIHNDYQELPAAKQRLFRRECLAFLHRLLDEEEPREQEALNLSNSADTDEEKESKLLIVVKAVPGGDGDGNGDGDCSRDILPH